MFNSSLNHCVRPTRGLCRSLRPGRRRRHAGECWKHACEKRLVQLEPRVSCPCGGGFKSFLACYEGSVTLAEPAGCFVGEVMLKLVLRGRRSFSEHLTQMTLCRSNPRLETSGASLRVVGVTAGSPVSCWGPCSTRELPDTVCVGNPARENPPTQTTQDRDCAAVFIYTSHETGCAFFPELHRRSFVFPEVEQSVDALNIYRNKTTRSNVSQLLKIACRFVRSSTVTDWASLTPVRRVSS